VQVTPPQGYLPDDLRLGPIVEVWAEPAVIAAWQTATTTERDKLPDPLVRAFRNYAAARLTWLTAHGYTVLTAPPGMSHRAPHWARHGPVSGRDR
jgi:hypothetical protein